MSNPLYQGDGFKDEAYDTEMAYRRGPKQMINPNPNRGENFFPNHDRRRDYLIPTEHRIKVKIPSFSENLNIKSFLDWFYKVEKFFDMAYIHKEKHVKFIAYKLKGGASAWWDLQITRRR